MSPLNHNAVQATPKGTGPGIAELVIADLNSVLLPAEVEAHGLSSMYERLLYFASYLRNRLTGDGVDRRLVADDMDARARVGEAKYGERLAAHNGRNATLDLYQEILDAVMYMRQVIAEGK